MSAQKPTFVRCPRCELNYIKKGDKLCAVCQAKEKITDEDSIDELDLEICPICKTNYVKPDEIMCPACMKERQSDDCGIVIPKVEEDEWEKYLANNDEDFVEDDEETGGLTEVDALEDTDLELENDLTPLESEDDEPVDEDDDIVLDDDEEMEALDEDFDDDDEDDDMDEDED